MNIQNYANKYNIKNEFKDNYGDFYHIQCYTGKDFYIDLVSVETERGLFLSIFDRNTDSNFLFRWFGDRDDYRIAVDKFKDYNLDGDGDPSMRDLYIKEIELIKSLTRFITNNRLFMVDRYNLK
jgi:hypothetical protein